MSDFIVRLQPTNRGSGFASDPSCLNGISCQRTITVQGPNGVNRVLSDGETFTSTNYWKKFAPISQGGESTDENAIVHIINDDGSVWNSHNSSFNKFARVHNLTIEAGTTYTSPGNLINVLATYSGISTFTQITTDENISIKLNNNNNANFSLLAGTQVFDNGDLPITSLAFDNSGLEAVDATVEVILTIEIMSID